jgi:hypothetical protein
MAELECTGKIKGYLIKLLQSLRIGAKNKYSKIICLIATFIFMVCSLFDCNDNDSLPQKK